MRDLCLTACLYLASYWLLTWVSFLYAPARFDITPWNPAVAASFILILTKGPRWLPLLFIASFSFQLAVESSPADLPHFAISLFEACIYTAAACAFRRLIGMNGPLALGRLENMVALCLTATVAPILMAIIYIASFYMSGQIAAAETLPLALEYWCGDALGLLVIVPLYCRQAEAGALWPWLGTIFSPSYLLKSSLTILIGAASFFAQTYNIHIFYLLFIPLIWISVTGGIEQIALTILLILLSSLFYCSQLKIDPTLVTQFVPFLALAMAWIGLILGALTQERQTTHIQIIKSDARLRALLDMYPDCMLIVDIAGKIVAANQNFARLCDSSVEKLANQPVGLILPDFANGLNGETSLRMSDNSLIAVDVSTSKVRVGEKYSSILTVRDITIRKQAEEQQRQRRALSEQATRIHLTGGLSAALAHELNQPLSAIISYTSACQNILGQASVQPKVVEQLAKISSQALRAASIIGRLKEFYQHSTIDISPAPVLPLIHSTLGFIENEIRRSETLIEIQAPDSLIAAIDHVQIEQVLINLIRNSLEALKAVPADQRRILITATQSPRHDIEVVIQDNGPGIPAEVADKLFRPFVTTRQSGMGLGLVICHSIIEAHNGRLWAGSPSGGGTAMYFTMPLHI